MSSARVFSLLSFSIGQNLVKIAGKDACRLFRGERGKGGGRGFGIKPSATRDVKALVTKPEFIILLGLG